MKELENKIALVTSSTRGIGLACAKTLARAGAKVYLAVRRPEAGEEVAREIRAQGGQAEVVYFDAAKPQTHLSMVEETVDREGRIDLLVNNYGSTDVTKDLDLVHGDSEAFFAIVQDNLRSVYLPCKAAVSSMVRTGGGSIVNISSVGGLYPDLSRLAYGVAKSAINFLTQNIAVQYAAKGVRCNAVLPGFVKTDAALENLSPAFLEAFLSTVPLGRAGTPQDIADAVLFLCSDRAAMITGETLPVAGGFGLPSPLYPLYRQMGRKG